MDLTVAGNIANALLDQHCPVGWSWSWSRGRTQFGVCQYGRQNIKLSAVLTQLNDQPTFEGVVKHEIAHVLSGPDVPAHGRVWKAHARALGIRNPGPCTDAVEVDGVYVADCPNHGRLNGSRHKMTYAALNRRVCRRCRAKIVWSRTDGKPIDVTAYKRPAPRRRKRRYAY